MRVYGNLTNRIKEEGPSAAPEVGQGATLFSSNDRHAYTVIEVLTSKRIRLQADCEVRTDTNGMSESQTYEFSRNEQGEVIEARLCKDGKWHQESEGEKLRYRRVIRLGERSAYRDPSF